MKTHYTYISTDHKRYYVGVRSCDGCPTQDNYLGSFTDETFKPVSKRILGIHDNREDAILAEIYWQRLFKVVENPLFVNRGYQLVSGFHTLGLPAWNKGKTNVYTDETIMKMSEAKKGRSLSAETRKKMSDSSPRRRITDREKALISEKNSGKNHGYYEERKYLFIHKDGTELELTPFEFRKKLNAAPSSISDLKSGNRRAWKGWIATCLI